MRKTGIIAWLLVAAMSVGLFPVTAYGDEPDAKESEIIQEETAIGNEAVVEESSDTDDGMITADSPDDEFSDSEAGTDASETAAEREAPPYTEELPEQGPARPENRIFDFEEGEALDALMEKSRDFPEYFDLRHVETDDGEVSYVTPVRLQNPYGTCWGYAAIAAAESSLLSSGLAQKHGYDVNTLDLSEKHTAYFATSHVEDPRSSQYPEGSHFRNIPADQLASGSYRYNPGGVAFMATSVFASGIGPVSEDEDPILYYRGKRGEMAYWEAATRYDDNNRPVEDSYEDVPVWYSNEDDWSIPEDYRFCQSFRLKDSIVLPDPAGYDDDNNYIYQPEAVEAIKQQLVEYHRAVCVSFCAESYLPGQDTTGKKYMSDKWAHYTNTLQYSNHMVTIVGYDDNYPKENFNSSTEEGGTAQPEGDGAFLMKNSWGSELNEFPNNGYRHWGLLEGLDGVPYDPDAEPAPGNRATGYFWISYYDQSMNDPEAFVFDDELPEYGCYTEETDCMHPTHLLGKEADNTMMANVFKAEATSELNEFSVMTAIPGTTVSYAVYLLGEGFEDPEDGILIEEGEQYFDYGGYHRIGLTNKKVLTKGQQFSVLIKESAEMTDYVCFAADYAQGYGGTLYPVAVINPRESFCYDGTQWCDESDDEIKAYLLSDYPGYDLLIDNFPIKTYLTPVTYPDGDEERVFEGYLTVNNWHDFNPGTFSFTFGSTKTLTAEFRGTNQDMPSSWKPFFTWESCDESILSVSTSTPRKGNAVLKGEKAGTTNLIVSAGDSEDPDKYGIRVLTINVTKAQLIYAELEDPEPEATYTGEPFEPAVDCVKAESGITGLVENVDYEVTYTDNINAGTASVIISGTGNYGGKLTRHFEINPASIKEAVVTVSDMKYTGKARKPKPTVKLGTEVLKRGTDYTVSYKNNTEVGTALVEVTGRGNYTGTIRETFRIVLGNTAISSLTSAKKGRFTVKCRSVTGADGYQIRYGLKKNLSDGKTLTGPDRKKTVTGLTSGKKYYVKVRAFRLVNGKKKYSDWTGVDSIKVK